MFTAGKRRVYSPEVSIMEPFKRFRGRMCYMQEHQRGASLPALDCRGPLQGQDSEAFSGWERSGI